MTTPTSRTDAENSSDSEENTIDHPKSWAAWKRKSEQLERELAQAQAEAAAMRLALEGFRDFCKNEGTPCRVADTALTSTAGAELLERLKLHERMNADSLKEIAKLQIRLTDHVPVLDQLNALTSERDALRAEVERLRENKAQVLSRYTTAWHALNAIAADGSPYAKRMVEELPRPAINAARKEQP